MTDAPTPSGAMLVWRESDGLGEWAAETPFFGAYRVYAHDEVDDGYYAYLLGHMRSERIGGIARSFPTPDAARAAGEADCREKVETLARAAGWVPAGESERLRLALSAARASLGCPDEIDGCDRHIYHEYMIDAIRAEPATPGGQHDD